MRRCHPALVLTSYVAIRVRSSSLAQAQPLGPLGPGRLGTCEQVRCLSGNLTLRIWARLKRTLFLRYDRCLFMKHYLYCTEGTLLTKGSQ